MSDPLPIEVRGLCKAYGDLVAVDDVDLTVEAGDVFGYLGPNGAGKTTTLRMMLGLIAPSAGSVRLFGRDPHVSVTALEGVAGFVEAPSFYPYLNGRTNLELLAALVTYGKGLGGIAVIQTASEPGAQKSGEEGGLSLPKVSINGAQGEELDTALGTVLRFSRGGVDYIVAGSVPPAAAEAAARAL